MSRGPIRIVGPIRILCASTGRFLVRDSPLVFVLILSVPTSERDLVLLVIDLEAFCASVGFVWVLGVGVFFFSECDY